jgi:hypothetical protein
MKKYMEAPEWIIAALVDRNSDAEGRPDCLGTLFSTVHSAYLSTTSGFDLRRLLCANHATQKTGISIAPFLLKNRKDYALRKTTWETTSPKRFQKRSLRT